MTISPQVIERLNSLLNIQGQQHLCSQGEEWVDRGCVEWTMMHKEQEAVRHASPELVDAVTRLQKHFHDSWRRETSQHTQTPDGPMDSSVYPEIRWTNEFFAKEPPHILREYNTYMTNLMILRAASMNPGFSAAVLDQVRNLLQGESALAYRTGSMSNTIVVAPTTNQFDLLRFEGTTGNNIGLGTEALIERLTFLDSKYGIDITGVGFDGVEFTLKRIPKGKEARELGKWLVSLCPDMLDPPKSFSNGNVVLWWD